MKKFDIDTMSWEDCIALERALCKNEKELADMDRAELQLSEDDPRTALFDALDARICQIELLRDAEDKPEMFEFVAWR